MSFDAFSFDAYEFSPEKREIVFRYSLTGGHDSLLGSDECNPRVNSGVTLEEKLFLPKNFEYVDYNVEDLDRALFAAHLMFGVSYYKAYCPKNIEIHSGELSAEQADFWNTVYTNGLGEFFYENEIDFRGLVNFPVTSSGANNFEYFPPDKGELKGVFEKNFEIIEGKSQVLSRGQAPLFVQRNRSDSEKILLPIGGGKDSLTSLALLEEHSKDFDLFTLRDNPIFQETEKLTGKKRMIIDREIDPKLFDLNKQGAYNGHIPISACISFLGLVVSVLYGYQYFVFSNENSANEGNTELFGMEVNHQWSKSFVFESLLSDYIQKFITPNVYIFSLLRPYSEYKIVEMFSEHPEYFSIFSSCNRNFHIRSDNPVLKYGVIGQKIPLDKGTSSKDHSGIKGLGDLQLWCGICPKCAFTFALLSAFLPKETLINIFGKNLFADESLIPLYQELLGLKNFKPFECVGEPEEVRMAMWKAYQSGEYSEDPVMKLFEEKVLPDYSDEYFEKLEERLLSESKEHLVPDGFFIKNKIH